MKNFFSYLKVNLGEDGVLMDSPLLPSATTRDGVFERPRYIELVELALEDVGKVGLV